MKDFKVAVRYKCKGLWVNVYYNRKGNLQVGGGYLTRKQADEVADTNRIGCYFMPMECIK